MKLKGKVPILSILRAVCYSFNVSPKRVKRKRGPNDDAKWARFVGMGISCELGLPKVKTGRVFNAHRTGVLHGAIRMQERMDIDRTFAAHVTFLRECLREKFKL